MVWTATVVAGIAVVDDVTAVVDRGGAQVPVVPSIETVHVVVMPSPAAAALVTGPALPNPTTRIMAAVTVVRRPVMAFTACPLGVFRHARIEHCGLTTFPLTRI
ncbi:hypothetical protein N8J89_16115 [Crossiella sp. CA-258035]|uniref:hypothetical protein n=1 Tax=Crossiella sp. CA-258035 TaxID=2981138 RepID=UPI0024BC7A5B|nr:hypothetical protein [Crossiella sp. CA-258035]WHT22526.1 hypothetical protein N8J89_16115 [Crossiella sp. CA-258035]